MPKPISTTIKVNDQASSVLKNISKSLGKCISGFMRLDQVSSKAISINAVSSMENCENILTSIDSKIDTITQSLRQAEAASDGLEDELEESLTTAEKYTSNLLSTVKKLAGAYLTVQGAGKVIETSDALVSAKQRLSLVLKDGEAVDDLNRKIMTSANNARASYLDTFNQVAKLATNAGDKFASTDQTIKFVEQFNKLGALSGASVYESSQAMYQLTQSMAKGRLDGDELRSIMEGMPLVAKSIADYLGTDVVTMKEFAAEGRVTAEVVRNALLSSAAETDVAFGNLPMTWAQQFEVFKNKAIQAFTPVLEKINAIAGNAKIQSFIGGLMNGIQGVANMTMFLIDVLSSVFGYIYDNWAVLGPILYTGLAVVGAYIIAVGIYNGIQAISNGLAAISAARSAIKAGATLAEAAATKAATGAQVGLNAAMLASPITWILILIIALIAAIFAVCSWIAKTTDVAESAFGIFCGGINVVIQFFKNLGLAVANIALGMWENAKAVTTNLVIAFKNAILNIQSFWYSLLSTVLNVVASICEALNKIPFIEFDYSGITTKANEYAAKAAEATGNKQEYVSAADAYAKGASTFDAFQDGWSTNAFEAGIEWGDGVAEKVDGFLNFEAYNEGLGDYGAGITDTLGAIEENTGKGVDISQEDLKYLRDIAEQQAINRFTTAEIRVEMNNNNSINNNMDLDGVVDHLATRVTEAMDAAAAGAY